MKENIDGVDVLSSLTQGSHPLSYDVVFLFHVLEHLKDPIEELSTIAECVAPGGSIVLEVPNVDDALLTLYDCEAFKSHYYWKCHLFYYSAHTLSLLLKKAGFKVDYVRQVQRYPLSNHLQWLRSATPGGHNILNFLNSDRLQSEYEKQLAMIGKCDTLIARIRL
jgi:SAM-dependent methyltransferase